MVSSKQSPVAVGRDEGQVVDARTLEGIGHDSGRPAGEPSEPPFLPGADDSPHGPVVLNGRTRAPERETAPRALGAPAQRPRRRRTATLTRRRADAPERSRAYAAYLPTGRGADEAALREQKVEHDLSNVSGEVLRDCVALVPEEDEREVRDNREGKDDAEHRGADDDQSDRGGTEEHRLHGEPEP